MDEKTAFIIGTSHSYGACIRKENGSYKFEDRVKHPNRWQDNLENYGYKVSTFARPGCTVQHQLDAFYHYLNDNPKLYWDLIIIERRDPESTVASPKDFFNEIPNIGKDALWDHWFESDGEKRITKKFNFDQLGEEQKTRHTKKGKPWYKEYVLSDLHLIDVWSANSALCSLASNYAKTVKWFSFGGPVTENQKSINLQNMFIGEYCIKNTLPFLQTINYKTLKHIFDAKKGTEGRCYCGHLNELGHKLLWDEILEPELTEGNIL